MGKDKWKNAEQWLKEIRQMYTDIGGSGVMALTFTINPILIRFERGERTDKIYNEIMNLQ